MAAAAVVVQHPVVCQDEPTCWIDREMNKSYIQRLQGLYNFTYRQIRDALIQLNEEGKRLCVDNLLVALRHPGDPLVHDLMETGNYTYLDVVVFMDIYSRTHNGERPTVAEFQEHYRQMQGIGVAQLLRDLETNTRQSNRMYERFEDRCRMEYNNYQLLLREFNSVQVKLADTQQALSSERKKVATLQNTVAQTRQCYTTLLFAKNYEQIRAKRLEQQLVNKEEELSLQCRTAQTAEAEKVKAQAEKEKAEIRAQTAQAEKEKVQAEKEKAEIRAQTAQAEKEKVQAEKEKVEIRAQTAQAEKEKAEIRAQTAQAEKEKVEIRAQTAQAEKEKVQAEKEKAEIRAQTAQAEKEKVQAEKEKVEIRAQTAQAEKEKVQAEKEKVEIRAQTAQAEKEKAEIRAQTAQAEKEKAEIRAQTAQAEKEKVEIRAQTAQAEKEKVQAEKEKIQAENLSMAAELEKLKKALLAQQRIST